MKYLFGLFLVALGGIWALASVFYPNNLGVVGLLMVIAGVGVIIGGILHDSKIINL